MKNLLLLTLLLTFLCTSVRAQCPVGNVVLETDAEVAAFANNWPNCTDLPGSLNIQVNVSDVSSLDFLKTIDGTLTIRNTPLTDLKGLHNIINITGGLGVSDIDAVDLASLPLNLEDIGGDLIIIDNASLKNIEALQNLNSADEVFINQNSSLTGLAGLDNVAIASALTITNNPLLLECSVEGICDAAFNLPVSDITISGNDGDCSNRFEVQAACTGQDCPPNIEVNTNQDISQFTAAFPNCTNLSGNLLVRGSATLIQNFNIEAVGGDVRLLVPALSDLDGLGVETIGGDLAIVAMVNIGPDLANGPLPLTSIGGNLILQNLRDVEELNALQNLTTLNGLIFLDCPSLNMATGLQNADFTGGGLFSLRNCDNLKDLDFLLPMLSGGISFSSVTLQDNALLSSITGLEGAGVTNNILISGNETLDFCSIDPVCAAIVDPATGVFISNNDPGCNSVAEVKAGCIADLAPLLELYNATDGPNWTNNTGWEDAAAGTNCTPCDGSWFGIICDADDRVVELSLSSNELSGSLPTGIGELQTLKVANFSFNDLTGPIPTEIFSLPALERIFFTSNNLTGGIPANIGDAVNLNSAIFSGNPNLGGTIPANITNAPLLKFFAAVRCGLTGTLPVINEGDLPELEWILVDDNNLNGNFSGNYGFLTGLTRIELNDNSFSGLIPNIFGLLPNLENLHLENNGFINGLPVSLNEATSLRDLKISNNSLNGVLRPDLRDLVNLEIFEADNNAFTGAAPGFDQSPNLTVYNVANNDLDGLVPDGLLNSSVLEEIDMSGNGFTGPLPLFPANSAATLTIVDMADNNFAGCYPTEYADLCGVNTNFSGNAGLPDGGSATGFATDFCQDNDECGSLPVSWLGFSARLEGKVARLEWRTATEENNAGFSVQRSGEGANWTTIGEVAAGGFDYTFVDEAPLAGTGYYRIGQTDLDGRVGYSPVASVRLVGETTFTYPNPFSDQITVVSTAQDVVELLDARGRVVLSFVHAGGGAQVQRTVLKRGVYTLRLRSSGRTSRMVKLTD